jgi:thioredoxin-dependent peroxiredoxin
MKLVPAVVVILVVLGAAVILLRPRAARAEMLQIGEVAPDFSTEAVLGEQSIAIHLSDFRGRPVVLYFYPKDNTPGCTKEACAFRDGHAKFQSGGITLLGCSIDSAEAHRAFARKHRLPFPLLLDPDKRIAKAYGAENGIPILGLDRRITYVIGEDGRILKVYPQVDPAAHASEILHDLGADKVVSIPAATVTPPSSEAPAAHARQQGPRAAGDSDTE